MPVGLAPGLRLAVVAAGLIAGTLCQGSTLLRAPYLQNVGTDKATVLWVTRHGGQGFVEYSSDGSLWRAVPAQDRPLHSTAGGATRHQHQADLRGLAAGQTYHYRVLLDGELLSGNLRFRTAARGPFTFLVFGDSGTGSEAQHILARRMVTEQEAAFVLHTGDVCQEDGALDRLEANYFAVYAPLMSRVAFFPTPGNHDYGTDLAGPYLNVHVLPASDVPRPDTGRYYSFDWGNAHFISLDSNLLSHPDMTSRMLEWLERDLQHTHQLWKVVFFHHPPYPTGRHQADSLSARVRAQVLPVLERHGVQVTFSGHEHNYQRSHPLRNGAPVSSGAGLVSIITGGGGGGLYAVGDSPLLAFGQPVHHYLRVRVEDWRLEITAVGLDGSIVDKATLAPAPEILPHGVVNAGSFRPELAPGALISIFGFNLALEDHQAPALPLPAELAGTSVSLNGHPLPLLFVSPIQLNAQLPFGIEGPAKLRVRTPNGSAEAPLVLAPAAPAVLHVPLGGGGRAPAIVRQSTGALVSSTSPAVAGETVVIYLVGLGAVAGEIAAGHPAPDRPPLRTRDPVEVRIGEASLTPVFAELTPHSVGLYRINAALPEELPGGIHPLRVVANGAGSQPVGLAVSARPRNER